MAQTLAIIPARGGSKRIPGKNIRPFAGKPLIQWSVEFARQVQQFDHVVVSTDSDEIAACCEQVGLAVPYRRPTALAGDFATSVDVALDALDRHEATGATVDFVALLQPTSPLRDPSRWVQAFDWISRDDCDAVIGVAPVRDHPLQVFRQSEDGALTPWTDAQGLTLRSQDMPPAVVVNGALYLVRASVLRRERTFFPRKTRGVVCVHPWESIDIDTEPDWVVAEALAAHYGRRP